MWAELVSWRYVWSSLLGGGGTARRRGAKCAIRDRWQFLRPVTRVMSLSLRSTVYGCCCCCCFALSLSVIIISSSGVLAGVFQLDTFLSSFSFYACCGRETSRAFDTGFSQLTLWQHALEVGQSVTTDWRNLASTCRDPLTEGTRPPLRWVLDAGLRWITPAFLRYLFFKRTYVF